MISIAKTKSKALIENGYKTYETRRCYFFGDPVDADSPKYNTAFNSFYDIQQSLIAPIVIPIIYATLIVNQCLHLVSRLAVAAVQCATLDFKSGFEQGTRAMYCALTIVFLTAAVFTDIITAMALLTCRTAATIGDALKGCFPDSSDPDMETASKLN